MDGTLVDDAALLALAPLAPSLEVVSACYCFRDITDVGLGAALAAFAERGGAPKFKV